MVVTDDSDDGRGSGDDDAAIHEWHSGSGDADRSTSNAQSGESLGRAVAAATLLSVDNLYCWF